MKDYVEIRLVNISDCGVGLKDTAGRFYNIPLNGQLRISLENFQMVLDEPVSKKMICKGLIKVEGITEEMLRGSILSEDERDYLLGGRIAPVEESEGIKKIEIEEEKGEIPIVKAITFYNWIKNDKEEKIREVIKNPVNYDTLKDIIAKNDRYKTEIVEKILGE